jgi:CDP-diacylglycerol--glycerol-3-phosphate 3-phosphatidyltransferase
MTINAHARQATDRLALPVGRTLVRVGVSANALTATGLAGTLAGVGLVVGGRPVSGGSLVAVASLLDALDGTVARLNGSPSAVGSFYDSVADRVADAAILGGAAWLVRDDPLLFAAAVVALAGALLTSYVRAKAEALGWQATVGIIERPERVIILVLGIVLGQLGVALTVLAVGSVVTVAQRVHAVLRQARVT